MKLGKRVFGAASCKVGRTLQVPEHMRDRIREVSAVYVPIDQRKQGFATELMCALCNEADADGYVLLIHVNAYGDPDLSNSQLETWYERFNFMTIQSEPKLMARQPGSTPRFLTPIATATQQLQ